MGLVWEGGSTRMADRTSTRGAISSSKLSPLIEPATRALSPASAAERFPACSSLLFAERRPAVAAREESKPVRQRPQARTRRVSDGTYPFGQARSDKAARGRYLEGMHKRERTNRAEWQRRIERRNDSGPSAEQFAAELAITRGRCVIGSTFSASMRVPAHRDHRFHGIVITQNARSR